MESELFSVIVPARNGHRHLEKLLFAIQSQVEHVREVIVVDCSDDLKYRDKFWSELAVVPTLGKKLIIAKVPPCLPGAARNYGISIATGDWVSFLDCKSLPCEHYFASLSGFINRSQVDAVFGKCIFSTDHDGIAFSTCALTYGYGSEHSVLPTLSLRTSRLRSIRPFREDLRACEDLIFIKEIYDNLSTSCSIDAKTYYRNFPETLCEVYAKWELYGYYQALAGYGLQPFALAVIFHICLFACLVYGLEFFLILFVSCIFVRSYSVALFRSKVWLPVVLNARQPILLPLVAFFMDAGKITGFLRFYTKKLYNRYISRHIAI